MRPLEFLSVLLVCSLGLSACATSEKVIARQLSDASLSCADILAEQAKLDRIESVIEANKGLTATNIAAAVFWWPGLAFTYYDASLAEERANERRAWLKSLQTEQDCA